MCDILIVFLTKYYYYYFMLISFYTFLFSVSISIHENYVKFKINQLDDLLENFNKNK